MEVWNTIWQGLVAGVIIGPLARLVLPGKQNINIWMTIVLGAVGAIVGELIYEAFGGGVTAGIDWWKHVIQVAVAAVAVIIYERAVSGRKPAAA